jgi:hypothetical protein
LIAIDNQAMKKLVLTFILLSFSSFSSAFYTSEGRLYNESHRDLFIDNIRAIDLDFLSDDQGFILFNDGILKVAAKSRYGLVVDSIYLKRNVTEISYPHFLTSYGDLYFYNSDSNRFFFMIGNIEKLCFGFALEKFNGSLNPRLFRLNGNSWESIRGNLPHFCQ